MFLIFFAPSVCFFSTWIHLVLLLLWHGDMDAPISLPPFTLQWCSVILPFVCLMRIILCYDVTHIFIIHYKYPANKNECHLTRERLSKKKSERMKWMCCSHSQTITRGEKCILAMFVLACVCFVPCLFLGIFFFSSSKGFILLKGACTAYTIHNNIQRQTQNHKIT